MLKREMSTATRVSVEEYLATSYRPDLDYLDGEVVERNVGEYMHGALQARFGFVFNLNAKQWNVKVSTEQRLRVTTSRYRVPDVCVFDSRQVIEPVLTQPPLICIEILSKDDSFSSMQERIDDYVSFGVPNIWMLDPIAQRAWIFFCNALHPVTDGALRVTGTPIEIRLAELFADLA
jgi:Uma2 family endonuclease